MPVKIFFLSFLWPQIFSDKNILPIVTIFDQKKNKQKEKT